MSEQWESLAGIAQDQMFESNEDETERDRMANYVVTLRASGERDVEVTAESPEEAVRLAEASQCGPVDIALRADSVETTDEDPDGVWTVLGKCEACMAPLLMPESSAPARHVYAGDGVDLCLSCAAKFDADELVNGDAPKPFVDFDPSGQGREPTNSPFGWDTE